MHNARIPGAHKPVEMSEAGVPSVSGVPRAASSFIGEPRRACRIQAIVMLMAYYSKKIQSKIAKGKRCMG